MNENISIYLSNKKRLIPLEEKTPIFLNWVTSNVSRETLIRYNKTNYGWVLDNCDLVIDVDPRNGGAESFAKLTEDIGIKFTPTVITPSGGFHIYLSKPADYKISKNVKKYPGIDFLSYGRQCVIVGSIINDKKYEWHDGISHDFTQVEAPIELLSLIHDISVTQENVSRETLNESDEFEITDLDSYSDFPVEKIIEFLYKIDASCPYDKWIKIGMALQSWDKKKGFRLWEEWSKTGNNYTEGETKKHWGSFKEDKSVSIGTLIHYGKQTDRLAKKQEFEDIKTDISRSTSKEELDNIIDIIRLKEYEEIEKEILVQTVQAQYKAVLGLRIPIKDIRNKVNKYYGLVESGACQWWKKWVYVNSHNAFMNIHDRQFYKTESFNVKNGVNVPANENGNKISASKFVSDNGLLDIVNAITYLPQESELIIDLDGQKIFNTFNPNTVPVTATSYTAKGQQAIDTITNHIKIICNNDSVNVSLLTQWLAHQVQFIGEKLLWSPIIQAIQGVGKSFFGELLRCCIGDANVGTINPTQVTSQFNGWSKGVAVNVLEELRVVGHNRFEVINALKPLITDRIIQINEKGVKQFITYNTTNYICFTNYKDSIPIEDDDRRWWVIFTNLNSLKEIEAISGKTLNEYFTDLFDSLKYYSAEIRKWLLDYKITKEFKLIKQAPQTNYKLAMINTENNNVEGLFEVKELLVESKSIYYNTEILDSAELFRDCINENPDLMDVLNRFQKNKILKLMGFTLFGPVKLNGRTRKIWTKKTLKRSEILQKFGIKD